MSFNKTAILVAVFAVIGFKAQGQTLSSSERPKLMVGLVVDQMRWDFLYRYQDHFGPGGFNRLLNEGFVLDNVMIDYIPTVTALGHTSVYTGSVPSIHGIAGNDWIDRATGASVYCTTDPNVHGVGSSSEKIGAHSPVNLWSTTITDQLGIATNFQSKVIGVSLKDRASILPAGHRPTGAFWFDEGTGHFVTSSYYMEELPEWLVTFNSKNHPQALVKNGWSTLKPISSYVESTQDEVAWEGLLGSAKTPTFPYRNLPGDFKANKNIIRTTPFGNTLTLWAAEAAVEGNQMGADEVTDFLVVNLASTDYVGHKFGPNSIEVQDTYLRLDQDLSRFFAVLDKKVGAGNYTVFVTADHGAAHAEGYMKANKMKSGFYDIDLIEKIEEGLEEKFDAEDLVLGMDNFQIYLDHVKLRNLGLSRDAVAAHVVELLSQDSRLLYAVDLKAVGQAAIPEPIKSRIINGYNWKRSGDIQLIPHDGLLPSYSKTGTTHSVWNSYDAHIPLIFMGKGIPKGRSTRPYHMTDIAPTIAQLLKVENPSGNIGQPISELLD